MLLVELPLATGSTVAIAQDQSRAEILQTIPVQQTADPVPATEAESDHVVLTDIVVTATKRRALLRTLPQSLTALTGAQLENAGSSAVRDYITQVPGVQMTEQQPDLFRVSMRGIQTDVSDVTPETTGFFLDEVPFNDPFINHVRPDVPLFDLERVEIIKGPQGTLFGGSALAGALRYKFADALPGTWAFRTYGQYQTVADGSPNRTVGAAANVPVFDQAAFRLAAVRRFTGGTIDDLRTGSVDTDRTSNFSGRALIRWNVTDAFSVGVKGFRQWTHADDVPLAETTDGEFTRSRALRKSPSNSGFDFGSLDLSYRLPWADAIAVTSLLRKDNQFAVAYGERILAVEQAGQPLGFPMTADVHGFVQELRLQSRNSAETPWQWLVGAFGHRYHGVTTQLGFVDPSLVGLIEATPLADRRRLVETIASLNPDAMVPNASLLDFVADVHAQELALFGEVTRALGERFALTLGLRGYRVETSGFVTSSGPLVLTEGSVENTNDASKRASGVNPKLAVQARISRAASTYVSVARGFRFGGIQVIGPSATSPNVPKTYSPDSLWNYEIGLRTSWLDGTLQLDGAVFYIDWKNPQIQTTTGGAVPLNVIDNVGHARSYGGESTLRYLPPITGLSLSLSGAFTNARTTESFTAPSGNQVPAGSRLPGTANHQWVAELAYERQVGAGIVLAASVIHNLQGPGVSDIEQSMKTYDYRITDVRAGVSFTHLACKPKLNFGVFNLEDRRAVVSGFVDADNITTVYNRPRTYDVRLDFEF